MFASVRPMNVDSVWKELQHCTIFCVSVADKLCDIVFAFNVLTNKSENNLDVTCKARNALTDKIFNSDLNVIFILNL